ncbi:MAG TPA: hypothetical protein VGS27_05455 [Candidatus Sulfotelmatobacter sp.]|nr:hypothetical protein [Candidatus Sulfotelmatobacter sp.]
MFRKVLRVSEWVVNVGSLALLVFIAVVLVGPHRNTFRVPARPAALKPGQAVPIRGIHWQKSHHTLVLALQTGCHFCAASAPFYRELLKKKQGDSWQAVAVLPQPVEKSVAYMQREGYSVPVVRQVDLPAIGVSGTPTLLLVDGKGRLEKEWVGELGPGGENEVAAALGVGKVAQSQPKVILAGMVGGPFLRERSQSTTAVSAVEPSQTKRVMFDYDRNAPVRIVQILEGTTDVTPRGRDAVTGLPYKPWTGKPFQAGDDWVKNIILVLENFSDKQVTAVDFHLLFPQTGTGQTPDSPVVTYTIAIGRKPDWAMYGRSGRKHTPVGMELEPFSIPPDQKVRIALAPFYDAIKAGVERKDPIRVIDAVRVDAGTFYFADGTRWAIGQFERPDPTRLGTAIRITHEEWIQTGR